MREPIATVLLPGDPNVAEALRRQDTAVEKRLLRMTVRVYLNSVARGQEHWANASPPKTWQLMDFQNYLETNPSDPGYQYRQLLADIITKRIEKKSRCRSLVVHWTEVVQDCY